MSLRFRLVSERGAGGKWSAAALVAMSTALCTAFTISLVCAAANKKGTTPRQYIYSRSTQPSFSSILGAQSVPCFVLIDGSNRNGVYITQAESAGVCRNMGLTAGCVLLTLDNRVVDTSRQAETYLSQHGPGAINFSYVPYGSSPPRVTSSNFMYDGVASGSSQFNVSSYQRVTSSPTAQQSEDSIEELENSGVEMINSSRSREGGLHALQANAALTRFARSYAQYMADRPKQFVFLNGRSPHVDLEGRGPGERARAAGISGPTHENLGMETRGRSSDRQLLQVQHSRMMSEPPGEHNHRANILDAQARYVGVGVARTRTQIYLVEEFAYDPQ